MFRDRKEEWDASRGLVVFSSGMDNPEMIRDWHLWRDFLRSVMERDAFAAAYERGRAMTIEQLVELALHGDA